LQESKSDFLFLFFKNFIFMRFRLRNLTNAWDIQLIFPPFLFVKGKYNSEQFQVPHALLESIEAEASPGAATKRPLDANCTEQHRLGL